MNWIAIFSIGLFSIGTILRAIRFCVPATSTSIMLVGNVAVTVLHMFISYSMYYFTFVSIPIACFVSYVIFAFLFRRFDSKMNECHLSDLQFAAGMAMSVLILTIVADIVISYAFSLRVDAFRWPIIALPLWSASVLVSIRKIQAPPESSEEREDPAAPKP